jgi:hypothetical protein
MKRFGLVLAVVAGAALGYSQIVPPPKNPPFFGDRKGKKDDESKGRSLTGGVKDENDNPAEGAIVQLKDTKTLQVRSFIVKEDGAYHFYGLSADVDYQVRADRRDATSGVKTLSVFDSRKAAIINLKLEKKK